VISARSNLRLRYSQSFRFALAPPRFVVHTLLGDLTVCRFERHRDWACFVVEANSATVHAGFDQLAFSPA